MTENYNQEIFACGEYTTDTSINVWVDGLLVKSGKVTDSQRLFSFQNDPKNHGKIYIKIEVTFGQIKINHKLIKAVAKINNNIEGFFLYTMFPKDQYHTFVVGEDLTELDGPPIIRAGETFTYYWLVINSPRFWEITTTQPDVAEGMTIYGELYTRRPDGTLNPIANIPTEITHLYFDIDYPHYDYRSYLFYRTPAESSGKLSFYPNSILALRRQLLNPTYNQFLIPASEDKVEFVSLHRDWMQQTLI